MLNANDNPAPLKRSGSQKRQCTNSLQISLTPEQRAVIDAWAQAAGLSASAYGKAVLFGTPGPRARRVPHVNAPVMGQAAAALNRIGNVLNQTAHALNAGGAISMGRDYLSALDEVRAAARAIRSAAGYGKTDDDRQGKPA